MELLNSNTRILNIDESWLNDTQFLTKKWQEHGTTNSVHGHQVNPRISMIAGIDTEGDVYLALLQINNDVSVIKLFLTSLAFRLDLDRPNWRGDTVFLLDGATYHLSSEIKEHLQKLRINVIFTGPRSYDASPIELFWAHLKRGDINTEKKKTGKK
jgi:transposase